MKRLVVVMLIALLGACSKGYHFHPNSSQTYQARVSVPEVQVLFESPKEAYKTIGFFDYDFYRPGWASPTISEAMPSIKEKVHAAGGDAVVIRSQVAGLGMERNLRIIGDVIRFEK